MFDYINNIAEQTLALKSDLSASFVPGFGAITPRFDNRISNASDSNLFLMGQMNKGINIEDSSNGFLPYLNHPNGTSKSSLSNSSGIDSSPAGTNTKMESAFLESNTQHPNSNRMFVSHDAANRSDESRSSGTGISIIADTNTKYFVRNKSDSIQFPRLKSIFYKEKDQSEPETGDSYSPKAIPLVPGEKFVQNQNSSIVKNNEKIHLEPDSFYQAENQSLASDEQYNRNDFLKSVLKNQLLVRRNSDYQKTAQFDSYRNISSLESESRATAPTIQVTIGRIEVHAVMKQKQSKAQNRSLNSKPILSLNEYLKQRNGSNL